MAKGESDGDEEANEEGKRKVNRWWGALKSTGGSTNEEEPTIFRTYNIRNGRNGGMESALLEDAHVHVGLGHFPECRLHYSFPPIPDVVSAEYSWLFLICRTPGTL